MLKSLRGRLLASYVVVSMLTLLFVTAGLLLLSVQPSIRYFPALQQLDAISRNTSVELLRLRETGAGEGQFVLALQNTAVTNDVRILVADSATNRVVFDSSDNDSWEGVTINDVSRPNRLLGQMDSNTVYGRFQHPNGSTWLVYAQQFPNSRAQIYYAVREPTPLGFFRDNFRRPLLLAGGTALLLSLLFAFGIAGSVVRPLQQMARAAAGMAQGNYQQEVPVSGPEEVQQVAASFNTMAAQVASTQQAQRDFVANVSHDLKTPITSVLGWSQAMMDGTAVSEADQQRAASIIHDEAARMARMVNQLLDLAKLESGQLVLAQQPVDVGQLVTAVHRSQQMRAQEHDIHLTLDVQPVPPITGDYDRLTQVVANLVDNAFTHTPAGGRIHLQVKPHSAGALEIVVQDTGSGIPQEDLPRIFERFYQVDKSRAQGSRGTGLGLAIVAELVAAHNGRIQAHSQAGKGTVFIIRLPTSDQPASTTIIKRPG